jgi:hypothetical protein
MAQDGLGLPPEAAIAALTASGLAPLDALGWVCGAAALEDGLPDGRAWVAAALERQGFRDLNPDWEEWAFSRSWVGREGEHRWQCLSLSWWDDGSSTWAASAASRSRDAGILRSVAQERPGSLSEALAWLEADPTASD